MHAFHLPFRGQFLSLNQIFLLARTLHWGRETGSARTLPFAVSNVAAVLKSLSPAGQKLGPMAAISTQGFLFTCGPLLFGANIAGALLGACLASLWAFVQPLLTYLVIFGPALVNMAEFYLRKVSENYPVTQEGLLVFLAVVASVKLVLAIGVVVLAYRLPEEWVSRYFARLLSAGAVRRRRILEVQMAAARAPVAEIPIARRITQGARGAVSDVLNPLFLGSLALMALFLFFSESAHGKIVWMILRPLAIGFSVFFCVRLFPLERLASGLERRGRFPRFVQALRVALESLRRL